MLHTIPSLSDREREVLKWLTLGKTNWEIGEILDISMYTVKNHAKSIFKKLEVCNRTQATNRALSMKLLDSVPDQNFVGLTDTLN